MYKITNHQNKLSLSDTIPRNNFMNITDMILLMINNHYYDLQMYANFVICIENYVRGNSEQLSDTYNIATQITTTRHKYGNTLFHEDEMSRLAKIVKEIMYQLSDMHITSNKYLIDVKQIDFFKYGALSSTLLLKGIKIATNMPVIMKIFPCKMKHHYEYIPKNMNVYDYIESPLYALFFKEAWMFHFGKVQLIQYTSAFDCITGCYIMHGLPFNTIGEFKAMCQRASMIHGSSNTKRWIRYLMSEKTDNMINNMDFAFIEMNQIEGTLESLIDEMRVLTQKIDDFVTETYLSDTSLAQIRVTKTRIANNIINKKINKKNVPRSELYSLRIVSDVIFHQEYIRKRLNLKNNLIHALSSKKINLSIFFEYMYAKLVAAYIGRIIFTDDHFGNIAYITVDYVRHYKIKCNGCDYHFYMPPGKMVQFIDLERYIFNYSEYDIYTNDALKNIPDEEFDLASPRINNTKEKYLKNEFIYDKCIYAFANPEELHPNFFESEHDYNIMTNILMDHFVYDIKTFCQSMSTYLPRYYMTNPSSPNTHDYYIDLDNNDIRIIKYNQMI